MTVRFNPRSPGCGLLAFFVSAALMVAVVLALLYWWLW